jgi:penicillin-insensitive murein endopeptidase
MNPNRPTTRLAALILSACLAGAVQASPWGEVKTPSNGPTTAIGEASNGCIAGAESLPPQGTGYVSIRRYRNRHFGHPDLLRLVSSLGHIMSVRGDRLVMVGDLSQPRGGLMSSAHRSHQNGLDVDIWFKLAPSAAAAKRDTAGKADPPSMVTPDGDDLSLLWGQDQRALLKGAAEDPRVDRIFVNPAIKRGLCRREPDKAWLRKVRPWFGHDAHFHIRIKCPQGDNQCGQQAAIPPGDGCGRDLDWWFSEQARKPAKRSGARAEPIMPAACRPLLSGYAIDGEGRAASGTAAEDRAVGTNP